jgi:hypothetical protein
MHRESIPVQAFPPEIDGCRFENSSKAGLYDAGPRMSPDGKMVALCRALAGAKREYGKIVHIVRTVDNVELWKYQVEPNERLAGLAWSPDSYSVAALI